MFNLRIVQYFPYTLYIHKSKQNIAKQAIYLIKVGCTGTVYNWPEISAFPPVAARSRRSSSTRTTASGRPGSTAGSLTQRKVSYKYSEVKKCCFYRPSLNTCPIEMLNVSVYKLHNQLVWTNDMGRTPLTMSSSLVHIHIICLQLLLGDFYVMVILGHPGL